MEAGFLPEMMVSLPAAFFTAPTIASRRFWQAEQAIWSSVLGKGFGPANHQPIVGTTEIREDRDCDRRGRMVEPPDRDLTGAAQRRRRLVFPPHPASPLRTAINRRLEIRGELVADWWIRTTDLLVMSQPS